MVGCIILQSVKRKVVRTKNRRTPAQMIPSRHRLGMLEQATLTSSWVEVDKWEVSTIFMYSKLMYIDYTEEGLGLS